MRKLHGLSVAVGQDRATVDRTGRSIRPTTSNVFNSSKVLSVCDLCKSYSQTLVTRHVSFCVQRQEIVGLLGPNGAGKTTIISMILGLLTPTSGTIHVAGIDISQGRSLALSRSNFAASYAPLPGNLTITQNLRFFGRLYGVPKLTQRIGTLLEQFDLEHLRNTKCGILSTGEQTRAVLAKALLNYPELLVLDEPTASLDPSIAQSTRSRIRQLVVESRCGILWATHNMREVEEVCDRVLFLSQGRILLEGNPIRLPRENGVNTLEELFIQLARKPLVEEAIKR